MNKREAIQYVMFYCNAGEYNRVEAAKLLTQAIETAAQRGACIYAHTEPLRDILRYIALIAERGKQKNFFQEAIITLMLTLHEMYLATPSERTSMREWLSRDLHRRFPIKDAFEIPCLIEGEPSFEAKKSDAAF